MQTCFVHLGDKLPKHLQLNLLRMQSSFPEIPPVLVGNSVQARDFCNSNGINYFEHVPTEEERIYLTSVSLNQDFNFRGGFWKFSIQRIFAASQFAQTSITPVLHIESDMLILPTFPFKTFADQLKLVSWQKFSENHDVASLLWFPSASSAADFSKRILEMPLPESNPTDMTILNALAKKFPKSFDVIPSAASSGQLNPSVDIHPDVTRNIEKFGGYFDAAAIGMWVFGQDPRNFYGFSIRNQDLPHSRVSPRGTKFLISHDGRCIDSYGEEIFAFHVHSKDLKLFSDTSNQRMNFYFRLNNSESKKIVFNFDALSSVVSDFWKRGMIPHLIYNIPFIKASLRFIPGKKKIRKFLIRS